MDPDVKLDREGEQELDSLRNRLHEKLCFCDASPNSINELEERVRVLFPPQLAESAIKYSYAKLQSGRSQNNNNLNQSNHNHNHHGHSHSHSHSHCNSSLHGKSDNRNDKFNFSSHLSKDSDKEKERKNNQQHQHSQSSIVIPSSTHILSHIGHKFQSVLMKDVSMHHSNHSNSSSLNQNTTGTGCDEFKSSIVEFVMEEILRFACKYVKNRQKKLITRQDIDVTLQANNDFMDLFLTSDDYCSSSAHSCVQNLQNGFSTASSPSTMTGSLLTCGAGSLSPMTTVPSSSSSMLFESGILSLFSATSEFSSHSLLNASTRSRHAGMNNSSSTPSRTYNSVVQEMAQSEKDYMHGLKLAIKLFRAKLFKLPCDRQKINRILANLSEIQELSTSLLDSLEEAINSCEQTSQSGTLNTNSNMSSSNIAIIAPRPSPFISPPTPTLSTSQNHFTNFHSSNQNQVIAQNQNERPPFVGSIIFELAEDANFDIYATYTDSIVSQSFEAIFSPEDIKIILGHKGSTSTQDQQSFEVVIDSLVPRLLLAPTFQCLKYFKSIKELHELSYHYDNQDDSLALKDTLSILISLMKRLEHTLTKFKVNVETYDKLPRSNRLDQKLVEAKISCLFENKLNDLMLECEENALILPRPGAYRFAEPDTEQNIIYDESQQISCATILKLIECITKPTQTGTTLAEKFLTTYRSFMSNPEELLDLLIERFHIPEPKIFDVYPHLLPRLSSDQNALSSERVAINTQANVESLETSYREALERFRNDYSQPVRIKVINVLKIWVRDHYYDFERYPSLMDKLQFFLAEVQRSNPRMKKIINAINRNIEMKKQNFDEKKKELYNRPPPPFEWHTAGPTDFEKFDILSLHPIELARQLTLLEFELFRAIKPSELINAKELDQSKPMSHDEETQASPNLSKFGDHIDKISYWIRLCIIEADDFNHRVKILSRVIEIMYVMNDLNNFAGLLCLGGAVKSACVNRLNSTFRAVRQSKLCSSQLKDYDSLTADSHMKVLQERLRTCNPPCIPFIGSCLTKLIHAKEGNQTFKMSATASDVQGGDSSATVSPMINFRKQRIRADIISEICQYQNQPYCLAVQPEIRRFIESIDLSKDPPPTDDEESGFKSPVQRPRYENDRKKFFDSLDDYLWKKSNIIEPRDSTKPRKTSRAADPSWKSPGIRPRSSRSHPTALPASSMQTEISPGTSAAASSLHSPSTPLTPQTPPLSGGSAVSSEHSVFDQAFTSSSNFSSTRSSFGGSSTQLPFNPDQSLASFVSSSTVLASSIPDELVQKPPPPLPPRRSTNSESSSTSNVPNNVASMSNGNSCIISAANSPAVLPAGPPKRPPPLPPRTNRQSVPPLENFNFARHSQAS